jgi:hypothetical protein
VFGPEDEVDDIEALLRELDVSDLDIVAPPADVWDGIRASLDSEAAASDNVVPLIARPSRFTTSFFAAAAAVAVIAVGAVVIASIRGGGDAVLATAQLTYDAEAFDPLGANASATARLVEHDGGFEIQLDDASLPNPDINDLELWLIAVGDDGTLDPQPVSLVDPASPGTYAVPPGLDPDVYSIVDISVEPRDGDEAHSGRSILRGQLADV